MTSTSYEPPLRTGVLVRGLRVPVRILRGRDTDGRWVRPALLGLLAVTALLYTWGLGASGWANSFYSAAAQAGAVSWKALFYGSLDAANFITVDKTPASLWVMGLSARVFGVNPWSMLVPQALEGVATVGLVFATVRRGSSPAAGLLAGAALATTPVATLMFRFDNPDALLVLLLVAAAYATVRAVETAGTGWLVLAGTCVGFGFLTKMLQAFLVVPVFALVYLIAAPTGARRRLLQLLAAGVAVVVSAGWWPAIVELVPASARPYIGGSQHNSILELTFGYNGLGRLGGTEIGSVGGGAGGGWGQAGLTRMFAGEIGGQIAWLLPAALLLLVVLLVIDRRVPRTDAARAVTVLWGGWLLLTGGVFSLMAGIFHAYYTVALAPAIAALFGMGVVRLWSLRRRLVATGALTAVFLLSAGWAWVLLGRSPDWYPWLRDAVVGAGLLASAGILLAAGMRPRRPPARLAMAVGLVAVLAGPLTYSVQTAASAHTGAIPSAGPATRRARRRRGCAHPAAVRIARRPGARWTSRYTGGQAGPRRVEVRPGWRGRAGGWPRRASRGCPAGRRRWPAAGQHTERGPDETTEAGRRGVHVGRGGARGQQRVRIPAGHRSPGDGARRVQRHRPCPDRGAVPAVCGQREDPLFRRRFADVR